MCIIVAYGLSNALVTIFAYMALRMLPLSDVVVFGHTGAVFTLILSRIFLRYVLSRLFQLVLSAILTFLINHSAWKPLVVAHYSMSNFDRGYET